jgi:hypothetical protein
MRSFSYVLLAAMELRLLGFTSSSPHNRERWPLLKWLLKRTMPPTATACMSDAFTGCMA